MKTTIRQSGIRKLRGKPRRSLRIELFASPILAARLRAAKVREQTSQLVEPARRAATDRRVHRETYRAKRHASCALHRARRIGVAKALTDKRVSRNLNRSVSHAAHAASVALNQTPRHRVRNTTLVVAGAGAASVAAYGGWSRFTSSQSRNGQFTTTGTAVNESIPPDAAVHVVDEAGTQPSADG